MSIESRLLTVERRLNYDDGLGDLAKHLLQELRDLPGQSSNAAPCYNLCRLIQTTHVSAAYPTTAQASYEVQGYTVVGSTPGTIPTLSASGSVFVAYNTGPLVPPEGTQIVVEQLADGSWVFEYFGSC